MKKINIIVNLFFSVVLLFPAVIFAVGGYANPSTVTTTTSLIINIGSYIWMIFAFIAFLCFVYAGVMFLMSGGEPNKIGLAKSAAIYGVVGIVVAILAYSILGILTKALS